MGKKYICFLSGDRVDLAVIGEEYTDFILQLLNHPEVRYYLAGRFPWTPGSVDKMIEQTDKRQSIHLVIIDKTSDNPAGLITLNDFNWPNRRAMLAIAVMPEFQNAGIGKKATELIMNYAFNTLGLRKICLEVYGFNERAVSMYKKLGFKIEGEFKNHSLKDGKYHTLLYMTMTRE
ncbi:MAG: GNAT family protein [candidate division WOR-3 bacterium]|nr:GNAT family protein [candidate division WOR-3 bacterium]